MAKEINEAERNNIIEYVAMDNQIKEASEALRTLKKRKGELSGNIIQCMQSRDISIFNIDDGKLILQESSRLVPLKEDNKKLLTIQFFQRNWTDPGYQVLPFDQKVDLLYEFLANQRERVEKWALRRTRNRVPK